MWRDLADASRVRMYTRRFSTTCQVGNEMGNPSLSRVVRIPVWAARTKPEFLIGQLDAHPNLPVARAALDFVLLDCSAKAIIQ